MTKSLRVNNAIVEGEVVAINPQTSEFLPFQELMRRRRNHGIQEAMKDYPVMIYVFDILYFDGVGIRRTAFFLKKSIHGTGSNIPETGEHARRK
jgi:DNA ligase-1